MSRICAKQFLILSQIERRASGMEYAAVLAHCLAGNRAEFTVVAANPPSRPENGNAA
jgi:hypothetical protein